MSTTSSSIILSAEEIKAITGCTSPSIQLRELHRQGFTRARRGLDRSLIVERAHYDAVCAGAGAAPTLSLAKAVDRLTRATQGQRPAARAPASPPPPSVAAQLPAVPAGRPKPIQRVRLTEWAALHYSPPPSNFVLRKWRLEGMIHPAPVLVGSRYYVVADAKHMGDGLPYGYKPLVDRLRDGSR